MSTTNTPQRRLPAEWEPQDAILLAWPHGASDWQPVLTQARQTFCDIAGHISQRQMVIIVAPDTRMPLADLTSSGARLENVRCYDIKTNDTWIRDFGPITVEDQQQLRLLDFSFNGWGKKFEATHDNNVTRQLHQLGAFTAPQHRFDWVLEGGSIESDGRGTILTTSNCLLEPNRNPQLNQQDIEEQILRTALGARKVLWLDHGHLEGDDTDAHIDTLARLCPDNTIVYVACDDPNDSHYSALKAMETQLASFTCADGRPYRLLPLPWPAPCHAADGHRLPATYANFLIINGAVLVPVYGDPADALALQVVAAAFPDHEIIGVNCRTLIEQHGSLHCVTMQLPQGAVTP
ncbi:agmatine deiminase family protein [Desulfurispirillum indicum]|uniref:agmatine deiminase family protein n=1 Tax=Desulfurispirillum indicum TaxID=936456 RepID=UPI001CFB180C|nr:agmatine deiminase family protein [Desulfurispirillum indicum]UCZ57845.1 agmatine deiminase family protein [Desulfurispirillum indicum]